MTCARCPERLPEAPRRWLHGPAYPERIWWAHGHDGAEEVSVAFVGRADEAEARARCAMSAIGAQAYVLERLETNMNEVALVRSDSLPGWFKAIRRIPPRWLCSRHVAIAVADPNEAIETAPIATVAPFLAAARATLPRASSDASETLPNGRRLLGGFVFNDRYLELVESAYPGTRWIVVDNAAVAMVAHNPVGVVMRTTETPAEARVLDPLPQPSCPACDGWGGADSCIDCDGDGMVEHSCGEPDCEHTHEVECSACGADGWVTPCESCKGTGVWTEGKAPCAQESALPTLDEVVEALGS